MKKLYWLYKRIKWRIHQFFTYYVKVTGNDGVAIQKAIDIAANKPWWKLYSVVTLSTGTYNIENPIVMKSNVSLNGQGIGKTILKA